MHGCAKRSVSAPLFSTPEGEKGGKRDGKREREREEERRREREGGREREEKGRRERRERGERETQNNVPTVFVGTELRREAVAPIPSHGARPNLHRVGGAGLQAFHPGRAVLGSHRVGK